MKDTPEQLQIDITLPARKRCLRCGNALPGRNSRRMYCSAQCKQQAYRAANADAVKRNLQAYRAANANKIAEKARAYRLAHSAERAEYQRAYRKAHAAELAANQRAYYADHVVETTEYNKAYYTAHAAAASEASRAFRAAHPKAAASHSAAQRVHTANEPCALCGKPNTVRHHPTYDQPLSIVWLCRSCHRRVHAGTLSIPTPPTNTEGGLQCK